MKHLALWISLSLISCAVGAQPASAPTATPPEAVAAPAPTTATTTASTPAPAAPSSISEDRYLAGSSLRIVERTVGDLLAAGGRVELGAAVDGDAAIAGGELRVNAAVARNLYAAGGRIQIDAALGHNLRAAGGQVELGPNAAVAGNATIAGGDISLRAPVKGSVLVIGGQLLIDAAIDGDVAATAQRIELGPNARIGGALRWRSAGELQRHGSAQVAGPVERLALGLPSRDGERRAERDGDERHGAIGWIAAVWWTLGLMLVAALAVLATPKLSARIAQTLRERSGMSLVAGFVVLACVPVAVLILLFTIIGVPLALLLGLMYLVLLPLAYIAAAVGLGQWALMRWRPAQAQHTGWRIGATLLALLLLALLGQLPWIGGWIGFAALLLGLGAIALQAWARRSATAA